MKHPEVTASLPRAGRLGLAMIGAAAIAVSLFLLVPLTQILTGVDVAVADVRRVRLIAPAPPPTPPAPEPEAAEPESAPPLLEPSLQPLTLQQLPLSLQPGMADALAMGAPALKLEAAVDVEEEMRRVFQFSDLAASPRMMGAPRFRFPPTLVSQGVHQGRVEFLIEIDETGRAEIHRVVTSSEADLIPVARTIVERARFTVSRIEGKPVRVMGRFPVVLNAN